MLSGVVDVAFTMSSWLEANFPSLIPELHFLHAVNSTFEGEAYPFFASTEVT